MKVPDWMREVQPDSGLTYRDIKGMFGEKSRAGFDLMIKRGDFPPPDWETAGAHKTTRVWFVRTIIREIERRNRLSAGAE